MTIPVIKPIENTKTKVQYIAYDGSRLSYANTFNNPFKKITIKLIELFTAKLHLLKLIRKFERQGVPFGQEFWKSALDVMGIELQIPQEQLEHIPKKGPVIVVANHPHGLVDGMVLAEAVGRIRTDYQILTRSILTGVNEVDQFMISVPFEHEKDAQQKSIEMRRKSMEHLKNGGVIVLFPSGNVATSKTWFGKAVEKEWNLFTAKMIRKSGATVVPIFFPGQNSRLYQIASQISPTLRQALLLYEVRYSLNKPQAPIIGKPFDLEVIKQMSANPNDFITWLREQTLSLH